MNPCNPIRKAWSTGQFQRPFDFEFEKFASFQNDDIDHYHCCELFHPEILAAMIMKFVFVPSFYWFVIYILNTHLHP